MMFKQGKWLVFLIFILVVGCKDSDNSDSDDLDAMQREEIETFISDNELEATRDDDGFYYIVVQENPDGRSQSEGTILSIYYRMSTLGGDEIAFYIADNGDPLRLNQGANAVFPVGLDLGLDLMREGETYRFLLPTSLAFQGIEFSSLITATTIIDLEVELVLIENEDDILAAEIVDIEDYILTNELNDLDANPVDSVEARGSELRYKRIVEGDSTSSPGGLVSITYTGTFLNGNQFDAVAGGDSFDFQLGGGEIISGLDEGVSIMDTGERALFIIPSSLAYAESVRVIPDFITEELITRQVIPDYVARVAPYQVLVFDVRLQ